MDVALCCIVGIRADHNFFQFLKNKNFKPDESFQNAVYLDYLPEGYLFGYEAGSFTSYLGLKICLEDELFDGLYITLSPQKLEDLRHVVIQDFKSLGIQFDENYVQLQLFTRFY